MANTTPARAITGPAIAQNVVPSMALLPPMVPRPCKVKTTPATRRIRPPTTSSTCFKEASSLGLNGPACVLVIFYTDAVRERISPLEPKGRQGWRGLVGRRGGRRGRICDRVGGSGSCRLRHRPETHPVGYAIDRVYWCRWRR